MAFDADSYAECAKPWTLKLRGKTYVAQPWSAGQARKLASGWQSLTTEAERRELWDGVLARLFPFRLSFWWLGDPRKLFWAMSPEKQNAAIRDFFEFLARQYAPQPEPEAPIVFDTDSEFPWLKRLRTAKRTTATNSNLSPSTFSGGTGEG